MPDFCPVPFIEGYITGTCLIIAIGPQNLLVLKQGIQKNYTYSTALGFALCDAILILLGVAGLGSIFSSNETLLFSAKWGGAIFLTWYGYRSIHSAFSSRKLNIDSSEGPKKPSLKETLFLILALSFLNPHAYLDTVVLLGSIGCNFPEIERPYFAIGGISASFIWFFSLAFGAKLLRPLFEKPLAWKVLDIITALLLWSIAIALVFHQH
jgi:L-lysine exporter family protein LysE/ArgO